MSEQSAAAKAKGVCHTEGECKVMYLLLDPAKKQAAIEFLRKEVPRSDAVRIPDLIKRYGDEKWLWHMNDELIAKLPQDMKDRGFAAMYNPHLNFGMAVRNVLRQNGLGEKELGICNLDDIYIMLLTDAFKEGYVTSKPPIRGLSRIRQWLSRTLWRNGRTPRSSPDC